MTEFWKNKQTQKHNKILDRVKRIWYLSPMRAARVQASLRICAVSPEPPLLAHTSSESRGTFRQKARSLALLNGWACAVKICHDGMLEDTNSLDGAHLLPVLWCKPKSTSQIKCWFQATMVMKTSSDSDGDFSEKQNKAKQNKNRKPNPNSMWITQFEHTVCCLSTAACQFVCVYSGLTSLSTTFQSYHDGVCLQQGAQCSLL